MSEDLLQRASPNGELSRGRLFLVVGNSGSGKDTLLSAVQAGWPAAAKPIRIPRRYITRAPHPSEPYISVTTETFEKMRHENRFCLAWQAYRTNYGIPSDDLAWLNGGGHVAVNVSRKIIARARRLEPDLKVVFVMAPLEITLRRLRSRYRESVSDPKFGQRLRRARNNQMLEGADLVIDNTGSLSVSAKKLRDYMMSFG